MREREPETCHPDATCSSSQFMPWTDICSQGHCVVQSVPCESRLHKPRWALRLGWIPRPIMRAKILHKEKVKNGCRGELSLNVDVAWRIVHVDSCMSCTSTLPTLIPCGACKNVCMYCTVCTIHTYTPPLLFLPPRFLLVEIQLHLITKAPRNGFKQ